MGHSPVDVQQEEGVEHPLKGKPHGVREAGGDLLRRKPPRLDGLLGGGGLREGRWKGRAGRRLNMESRVKTPTVFLTDRMDCCSVLER